jgi:ABC-2 type transport system ATP-binding protein
MVELKDIEFSYKKNKSFFKQLSLSLAPGHVYGLLGKNGAGKSTLLKQITGLLFPTKGEATVFGYKAEDRLPSMLEDIYLIPEEFELPAVKLEVFVSRNAVFYPKFDKEQFHKHLDEFEIPTENKLSNMSYGQKKKFLIAFGLATNARVLILDEPTNGLDIPSKSQFRKIVASSLDDEKLIIISTHQVRDLENLIDTVVVLEKGQIIFNKNIAEISERLVFEHNLSGISNEEILYSEDLPGKKAGIIANQSGIETRVDLELLFNGVVKNNGKINAHFSK